jgi:hypothetical protein
MTIQTEQKYGQYGGNGRSTAEHQAEAGIVRVPFGDRDTQNVPIDWAETMLRGLFMHHPGIFRQLLFFAATGNDLLTYEPEIAAKRRNRRPGSTE